MMIALSGGYRDDISTLQRHRIYNLTIDPECEDTAVSWDWVDKTQYRGGFEVAVNHGEVLVSFPQTTAL